MEEEGERVKAEEEEEEDEEGLQYFITNSNPEGFSFFTLIHLHAAESL